MDVLTDSLLLTLTEEDKRALRIAAAEEGVTMREIVRGLIKQWLADRVERSPRCFHCARR